MGNRAVITTPERKVGVYLHWNGGRDTIEPLLKYCELQGYRAPSSDEYGFARICQVMAISSEAPRPWASAPTPPTGRWTPVTTASTSSRAGTSPTT